MKTSVIHGISTFLVICYAQCVKVSLSLLMPVHFNVEQNSGLRPSPRVWLNGELIYFSKDHLPYALPALFCLLTIGLLPPVLLLTYPLLNKVLAAFGCENLKAVNFISQKIPINNLKPLLDSIQGCFKDNLRFFAGLYFFYRWTVLIIHMSTSSFSVYFTVIGSFVLFLLTVHTICQPYIKREHNIIDTLIFAALVLITFLSFFNYHRSRGQNEAKREAIVIPSIVQLMLIYLPVIVVGMHILKHLCKNFAISGCKTLLADFFTIIIPKRASRLRELVQTISVENDSTDTNEEELIHERLLDKAADYHKYS